MKRKVVSADRLSDYLPEFVYGGIDGCVTTFAVVAGASRAKLDASVVIILGFANLIADGVSMSVGNYLSEKAEAHTYDKFRERELWEIEHKREEEVEDVREIYRKKGFEGELLDQVVEVITADKDRWADTMMREEIKMIPSDKSPINCAIMTFVAFTIMGLIPLLVYLVDWLGAGVDKTMLFPTSCVFTSFAFLFIGYLKSRVTETNAWQAMAETFLLGTVAAVLAYLVGVVLETAFLG
ncbi:MAG: VIT1/CCC1 transporter family protein [Bacteroidota bacterium]